MNNSPNQERISESDPKDGDASAPETPMHKAWTWLRPKLMWILAGAGAVLAAVLALVVMGKGGGKPARPPARPRLPDPKDVEVPTVNTDLGTNFNTHPSDDYTASKVPASGNKKAVIDKINRDFS